LLDGTELIATRLSGKVEIFDVRTGISVKLLKGFTSNPQALALTRDGKRLIVACHDVIEVWDYAKRKRLKRITRVLLPSIEDYNESIEAEYEASKSYIGTIALSENDKYLASDRADGRINLWTVEKGKLFHTLKLHEIVEGLAFSPDGEWLASGGWRDNEAGERVADLFVTPVRPLLQNEVKP
jgi:WD40 repeat protein